MGCGAYSINCGFKDILKIIEKLKEEGKEADAICEFYQNEIPPDVNDALTGMYKFISCDDKPKYSFLDENEPATLCFNLDSDAIFSDFMREYHINLNTQNIHWYEFTALLNNLSGDSSINNIRACRARKTDKLKGDELKEALKLKQGYKIQQHQDTRETSLQELFKQCNEKNDFTEYEKAKAMQKVR